MKPSRPQAPSERQRAFIQRGLDAERVGDWVSAKVVIRAVARAAKRAKRRAKR